MLSGQITIRCSIKKENRKKYVRENSRCNKGNRK